jgi:flavin reductase (DIM6/NTAB) family NADH-FMN oxidoreductase RutF
MKKIPLGAKTFLYPMPVALIGAMVNNKPNYMPVAWCTIVEDNPPLILAVLDKNHYTAAGIRKNKCFSVNIPGANIITAVDYCGIYSGKKRDKSSVFTSFFGKLKTVPMVKECPLNLECTLFKTLSLGLDVNIFVGEIVETYCNKTCLTKGIPDVAKMKTFVYTTKDRQYRAIGKIFAKAWSVGKNYQ